MIQAIKNLFGVAAKTDYSEFINKGAIILDVRSKGEFAGGHFKNSINIPVHQLSNNLSKLKNKDKCIICCCASGMRSGTAKQILKSQGYTAVFNGGSWNSLQNKMN